MKRQLSFPVSTISQVLADQIIGNPALPSIAALGLEPRMQLLAMPRWVLPLPAPPGEIADQGLVDRSAFELTLHERTTDHALSTRANKTLARDNHRGDHHLRRDTDSPS